jgi:tetratricopeptide (TPR) repeat protein
MTPVLFGLASAVTLAQAAPAQTIAHHVAVGDSLYDAMKPAEAREQYRAALFIDAANYEALWKFARAQVDVAKQLVADQDRELREELYNDAWIYAAEAVRVDSTGADGHFMLAQVLGRLSRTKGGKDRVRFGRQIYDAAALALRLDSLHDGAHHVMGAWHAEVKRLSGITKFFAKTFLGGGFLSRASWDSAVVHLERAVQIRPDYIYHRLELAEVYLDLEDYARARDQLQRLLELPTTDVMDSRHKETAARLLEEVGDDY